MTLPVLYITGDNDEIVPSEQTVALFNMTPSAPFKELLVIEHGNHNDAWYIGKLDYMKRIRQFIINCVLKYQLPKYDNW